MYLPCPLYLFGFGVCLLKLFCPEPGPVFLVPNEVLLELAAFAFAIFSYFPIYFTYFFTVLVAFFAVAFLTLVSTSATTSLAFAVAFLTLVTSVLTLAAT